MAHWGWYWRVKKKHVARKICSKMTSIDSFKLLKNDNTGFSVQPLEVHAIRTENQLTVTYRKRKDYSYIIPIEKQACHYGGFRYFFKCPLCQQRMRFLYFAEKSIFLCRKCLNLGYATQLMRPTTRYNHKSKKIENVLVSRGGGLYKRPKRMSQPQFEQLRKEYFYYDAKSHQELNKELRKWYGPRIEPELDRFFDYVPKKP